MKNVNYLDNKKEVHYNEYQKFCDSCKRPINQNCHKSKNRGGLCPKCFNMNNTEYQKRKINKTNSKQRKNQRKYKNEYC